MISTRYLPTVDDPANPWIQLFQRVWDAHGGEGELSNFRVYGMAQAYTFVQALQAAGPNPTRQGIVEAVEQAGAEFQGPWLAPFRFSADRHAGISGVGVTRITGGATERLTPVLATDNGDAPITETTTAPTTPPANGIPAEAPAS
jgi:branched-chain amino acid transport system substrate-binding protein